TTAKYYIHSGRCIHRDINDQLFKDERVRNGELSYEEIEDLREEAEEETFKEVFYTEKGRVVYGGGGIAPDIELDQTRITNFGVELRRKNAFFNYSVDYMIEHEQEVELDFTTYDKLIEDFLDYSKGLDIEFTDAEVDSSLSWIANELAYNIISKKFGVIEGYKVLIREDAQLQEALGLFDRFATLEEMFSYAEELKLAKKE
ncbi:MAG: phage tail protein, partial [Candidatus Cloacimonetes bacterium]|nr:phage tail protein [Candidatus Cloacimonadota bacterium]